MSLSLRRLLIISVLAIGILATPAVGGTTQRVSEATDGTQGDGGSFAWRFALSRVGRFVAFESDATNLVADDTNGVADVFVRDRNADRIGAYDEPGGVETIRVSVSTDGLEADAGSLGLAAISGGGSSVAFVSPATNLIDDDTNDLPDVFVRDRDGDRDGVLDEIGAVRTLRISVASDGTEGNGESHFPALSGSGRYVVFAASSDNLVVGDTNHVYDVFVHDRDADRDNLFDEPGGVETRRLSVSTAGDEANGDSFQPAISRTGRFVAFQSDATNLVGNDTNFLSDVFVRDRDTDRDGIFDEARAVRTVRVNVATTDDQTNATSRNPSISRDGRFVVFDSLASNLVASDTNASSDVFLRDRDTDRDRIFDEPGAVATTRVSLTAGGAEVAGSSNGGVISANARWAIFGTPVPGLVPADVFGFLDVFVRGPLP